MKKIMSIKIFLVIALAFSFANSAFADDAEIKLGSTDGTTKFMVQDRDAIPVFSADSVGTTVINGTATVAGSKFSVGGSTFVVKDGNVGVGTENPGAKLEVAGQVKITGGAPGAGKVLKSDGGGLASWQVADSTFSIGQIYGGGKIFWLDASGRHGLIAATADQGAGIQWNNSGLATGATFDAVYAGRANTTLIISTPGTGGYAAKVCADYAVTVNNEYYDDWYLPSKYELRSLLYAQKDVIGGFAVAWYWSSTEQDATNAWGVPFNNGFVTTAIKTGLGYVRCVRGGP